MPSKNSAEQARLKISERAILSFIDGGYHLTTRVLCERLGVPERTFFNYFTTKADAIRPALERGNQTIAAGIADATADVTLADAIALAFRASQRGTDPAVSRAIVAIVLDNPPLHNVWTASASALELAIRPAIAARLGIREDSVEALMMSAAAASAVRIAQEHSATHEADPERTIRTALEFLPG